jgi:hypothetical protein
MSSGLAEQSPIYKHKVSDTLCPDRDSPKFAAIVAQPAPGGTQASCLFPFASPNAKFFCSGGRTGCKVLRERRSKIGKFSIFLKPANQAN